MPFELPLCILTNDPLPQFTVSFSVQGSLSIVCKAESHLNLLLNLLLLRLHTPHVLLSYRCCEWVCRS